MRKTDVFICGGGPAGLAAAIACRLQGFHVLLADSARPSIDKACGEGLMPDAVAALAALGIPFGPDQTGAFCGIRFIEGPRSVSARFSSGPARGVRRTHLHNLLHERAAALGTCLLWQTQVLSLDQRDDGVALQTTAGPVQARWVIGADGLNSRIRLWSGLDRGKPASKRIGLRTHLRIAPWSEFVEVYWSNAGQAYITPIDTETAGLAIVARRRCDLRSIEHALPNFPALAARVAGADRITHERGSASLSRKLPHVTSKCVALIGDASGSVDAVTGEGLGLAFRQAIALAPALKANDLPAYERAHRQIHRRPAIMSSVLLLLDRYPAFRRIAFQSLSRRPELFEHLLAVHTGQAPLRLLGRTGALTLGAQLLRG